MGGLGDKRLDVDGGRGVEETDEEFLDFGFGRETGHIDAVASQLLHEEEDKAETITKLLCETTADRAGMVRVLVVLVETEKEKVDEGDQVKEGLSELVVLQGKVRSGDQ